MSDIFNPSTTTGKLLIDGLNDHFDKLGQIHSGTEDPRIANNSIKLWLDTTGVKKTIGGKILTVVILKLFNTSWVDFMYFDNSGKFYIPGYDLEFTDVYTSDKSDVVASAKAVNNLYKNRSDSYNTGSSTTFATSKAVRDLYDLRRDSYNTGSSTTFATSKAVRDLYYLRSDSIEGSNTTLATSAAVGSLYNLRRNNIDLDSSTNLATSKAVKTAYDATGTARIAVATQTVTTPDPGSGYYDVGVGSARLSKLYGDNEIRLLVTKKYTYIGGGG